MRRAVFEIEVTARSPLLLSERPGAVGEPDRSLGYIPGSTLRGALAAHLLGGRQLAEVDDSERALFRRLFLDGRTRFGTLLPGNSSQAAPIVPQSVWTCKAHPWPEPSNHGLVDMLAHLLPALESDSTMQSLPDVRCTLCNEAAGGRLDRPEPRFAEADYSRAEALEPRRRLIGRTAIAPRRQTASPGLLYSLVAIETRTRFAGRLVVDEDLAGEVEALLETARFLSIGGDRTRGLGRVEMHGRQLESEAADSLAEMRRRLQELNEHVRRINDERYGAGLGSTSYIALTLTSDTVLLDEKLLPAAPAPRVLERYRHLWGLEGAVPDSMELRLQLQSVGGAGGWDGRLGMPRQRLAGYGMGSVWVYSLPDEPDDATLQWLVELEREGCGERVIMGYGGVAVAHLLHLQSGEYQL